jgi:PKD repeat protein
MFGSVTGGSPCSTPTFTWVFGDTTTASGQSVTHPYTTAGTYIVQFQAQDSCGNGGSVSTTATITGSGGTTGSCNPTAGNPITVNVIANGTNVPVNTPVNFSSSVSGAAGTATYLWNFGDGSSGIGATTSHGYSTTGTDLVTLTVTDSIGRVGCGAVTVTVTGTGGSGSQTCNGSVRVAPNGPYTGAVNQPVSFGGFAQTFNTGATISSYSWSFGDNTTGSGQSPSHTYTAAGTYTVTLTATDSSSQSCSATTTATIGGTSSGTSSGGTAGTNTATANGVTANTGGPYTGSSGTPIAFNATASTTNSGATIVSCVWSFGDNNSSAPCANASHTYNTNGTYTAVATVTDSSGAAVAATTSVAISGGSRTVTLTAGCNNVPSTFADNTPTGTLVNGISPQASLLSIWKLSDPSSGRYRGYFPGATQASDLPTLNRLDAIFVCISGPATLTEPSA